MSFLKQSGRFSVLNSVVIQYHKDIIKNSYCAKPRDMQLPGNILYTLRTYNAAHDLCSAAVVSPDVVLLLCLQMLIPLYLMQILTGSATTYL